MDNSNHEMKSEKTEMSEKNNVDLGMTDKNKDGKVYQCPMCADQLADDPGECLKCGMDLKEMSLEKAKENLIKKGFNVKIRIVNILVLSKSNKHTFANQALMRKYQALLF